MNPLESNKEPEIVPEETLETVELNDNVVVTDGNASKEISEEKTVKEAVAEPEKVKSDAIDYSVLSKQELVDALKYLIEKQVNEVKDEVELIKQSFYKKIKSDIDEQRKAFVEGGGDELDFLPQKDDVITSYSIHYTKLYEENYFHYVSKKEV